MSDLNNGFKIADNATGSTDNNTVTKDKKFVAAMIENVEMVIFSLAVVILIFTFFFRLCMVSGDSMNNTLVDSEKLIVTNLFYEPQRGDIVVAHQTGALNEPIVKRVIAVGGDMVDIDFSTMQITVTDKNGKSLGTITSSFGSIVSYFIISIDVIISVVFCRAGTHYLNADILCRMC